MATATKEATPAKSRARQPHAKTSGQGSSIQHIFPLSDDQDASPFQRIAIDQIEVPPGRRSSHNLNDLKHSILDVELMHPVVVMPTGKQAYRLLAGQNCLQACKALGWDTIPAHLVTFQGAYADDLAKLAEIDENLIRNDLSVLDAAEQMNYPAASCGVS